MRLPAPVVTTLAALLAAFGPPALAQDSGEGLQPRAPWAAPGAEVAEAADATEEVATQFPRVAPEPAPPVQEAPDAQDAQDQPPPPPEEERRLRTWELPTLEVVGSGLKEEERVGRYRQPRWTVERLFPLIDEAALAAVRQWTFVPAVQGGVAVAGYVRRPISFTLAR